MYMTTSSTVCSVLPTLGIFSEINPAFSVYLLGDGDGLLFGTVLHHLRFEECVICTH